MAAVKTLISAAGAASNTFVDTKKQVSTKFVSNSDNSELSTMVDWMNQIAHDRYFEQRARFKSMVSIDNPYLAILTNLVQMSQKSIKALNNHLEKL